MNLIDGKTQYVAVFGTYLVKWAFLLIANMFRYPSDRRFWTLEQGPRMFRAATLAANQGRK